MMQGLEEVRDAVSHAMPAVPHSSLTGFSKQRMALGGGGGAGAPRALDKAAPPLCKTQHSLNKSPRGSLSLCFKGVTGRCLCAVTDCYLYTNSQWCVVPVAVVFRVRCQAPHRGAVLLPVLLCASSLSARSSLKKPVIPGIFSLS